MAQVALNPPPALYSGLLQGLIPLWLSLESYVLHISGHQGSPSLVPFYTLWEALYPAFLCSLSWDTQGLQDAWSIQLGAVWASPRPQLAAGARSHPGSPLPSPRLDLHRLWVQGLGKETTSSC